jgi:regulator of protease activity HflC (stomatin/prohibitin superfamily)
MEALIENLIPTVGAAFFLLFMFIFFGIFLLIIVGIVRGIFSVKVWPGEVVAFHRKGSRRIKHIYEKPGRHWHSFQEHDVARLRLRVDEPILITSRPVEAHTHDGKSAIVTARLTMGVTNSDRYAASVVGKELEEWQEEVLPVLIAHVVSGYTFTQILNNREQVAQRIEAAVAAWFAGNRASDFGLNFKRAAIIEATSRNYRDSQPPGTQGPTAP